MKIVYCGYDFFGGCLETILDEGHEVIQLFTQAPNGTYKFTDHVLALAEKHHIPVYDRKPTEEMMRELFEHQGADLVISAGYKYIVPTPAGVGFRGVNVHPAMLPIGRGGWPIPVAILKNEQNYGVTIHEIVSAMDAGDILLQKKVILSEREDLDTLCCRCQMAAKDLIKELLSDFEKYWKAKKPQGEHFVIWDDPTLEDQTFTGDMTAEEVDRKIRAFGKTGTFTSFDHKNYVVYDASCWQEEHNYQPGEVVHRSHAEIVLALKDGFACLRFFSEKQG